YSPESPWPEWSADGTQLAYPGGPPDAAGSVYLYDVPTGATEFYAYFPGAQPDFAPDRMELVARYNQAFTRYTPTAGAEVGTIGGFGVGWPKWDPANTFRFAYLDRMTGASTGALVVHQAAGNITVQ